MKRPTRLGTAASLLFFATLLIPPGRAHAGMVLTQAALAAGLRLSTFASDPPNDSSTGTLGIGFNSTGGVLVTDNGYSNAFGLASLNGAIHMTQQANSDVVQVKD